MIFKKRSAEEPAAAKPTARDLQGAIVAAIYNGAALQAGALALMGEAVAADLKAAGISAPTTLHFAETQRTLERQMKVLRAAETGDHS